MKNPQETCNSSIMRACYILDLFTIEHDKWSLKDIAKECDITPSTAIPVMKALELSGFVDRDPETKLYTLGIKILEKSHIKANSMNIIEKSANILARLAREYSVNTHLGRLDQRDVIYLARYEAVVHSLLPSYVGKRVSAHCSAMGLAILANMNMDNLSYILDPKYLMKYTPHTPTDPVQITKYLQTVREQGYAVDDEACQLGGYCIGVPIFDAYGNACAAISCSMTKSDENLSRADEIKNAIIRAGNEISAAMGYSKR